MRKRCWYGAFVPTALVLLSVLITTATAGERVALVIGNAQYAHAPKLNNPLNDARDIGAAFDRMGFTVTRVENADRTAMWRSLREFSRAAAASDTAVVFYAGHGIEVDQRNFLVPVDARLASDWDVEREAVPLDLLMRAVESAKRLRVVILDACRDNPFSESMQRAGTTRSFGRGLAPVEPSGGTLVAYAAKGGTPAADGEGLNSPYSAALLRYLEEPGLDVGKMFRKVHDAVLASTGGVQEPFVYGALSGEDTYLGPPPGVISAATSAGAPAAGESPSDDATNGRLEAERLAVERTFWESIKNSDNPADFLAYKETFPGGTYEALADNRLNRLSGSPESSGGQVAAIPATPEQATPPASSAEPSSVPAVEAAELALGLKRPEQRRIQSGLASLGFDPGPEDGMFGKQTRAAIRQMQASRGMEATGFLDVELAKELLAAAEAEVAKRQRPGSVFRDCLECPEMVAVSAGSFRMGSPASEWLRDNDEGPVHRVTIPHAFAVGKYEVTFAEWDACVSGGGCGGYRPDDKGWGRGSQPVINVSWKDAQAYVEWLSHRTDGRYRLLSESEWEYAARAGTTGPFHFGPRISTDQANYDGNFTYNGSQEGVNRKRTLPVGRFPANGFGLHDVHGNVWEWVADCWYGSYAGALADGSARTMGGDCSARMVRGGSWFNSPWYLRSADRGRFALGVRDSSVGFRVARKLD